MTHNPMDDLPAFTPGEPSFRTNGQYRTTEGPGAPQRWRRQHRSNGHGSGARSRSHYSKDRAARDGALQEAAPMDDDRVRAGEGLIVRWKTTLQSATGALTGWFRRGAGEINALGFNGSMPESPAPAAMPGELAPLQNAGHGLGSMLGALDWDSVRAEVDRESRARVTVIGAANAGKSTLVNALKGTPVSPAALKLGDASTGTPAGRVWVEDLGLFTIIDVAPAVLKEASSTAELSAAEGQCWEAIQAADLVLWVLDGGAGMRAWEHEWICRVRATGKPLLVVLNKQDQVREPGDVEQLKRALACPLVCVTASEGTAINSELLPRMVDACPALNTALGRESPAWRHLAAQRATRRAALLSGLVGIEPVPLLDMPFQALIQLRLVLRIAAIYDEPYGDRYSRELLAALVGGVALRYAGQQLAKLVPVVGWVVSSALAAGGAWVIGLAAEQYFAHGRRVTRPDVKLPRIKLPRVKVVRE